MSPFKDLFERMQHNIDQLGDALSGTDGAQRLLDAEIQTLQVELHESRARAAEMKAQRITRNERLREASATLKQFESEALQALQARRTTAARELAERIARLQAEKGEDKHHHDVLLEHEKALAAVIEHGEQKLRRLRHQRDTLHASRSLQRAQAAVASRQPGSDPYPETAVACVQRARPATGHSPAQAATLRAKSERTPADAILDKLAKRLEAGSAAASPKPRASTRRQK